MASVEGTLLPVLPFTMDLHHTDRVTRTDKLFRMLQDTGLDPSLTTAALASFQENRSPMEGIWSLRKNQ